MGQEKLAVSVKELSKILGIHPQAAYELTKRKKWRNGGRKTTRNNSARWIGKGGAASAGGTIQT